MNQVMTLQKVAKIKSNLLELVDVLVKGDMAPEEVALDLASNVQAIQTLENEMHEQYMKTGYLGLYNLAIQKEEERTSKERKFSR